MKFSLKMISKKGAVFGVSAGVALGLTGAALAYWTSTGSGTGTAVTASAPSAIVVNQTATVPANLYPGPVGSGVPLSGTFTNTTNPGSVYITSVTATIPAFSFQTAYPSLPPCTQADYSITGTSNTPGEIAHGTNVGAWSGLTLTLVDNTGANQNNCQGVTVPITYAAS
jgi:hypothetical protein